MRVLKECKESTVPTVLAYYHMLPSVFFLVNTPKSV